MFYKIIDDGNIYVHKANGQRPKNEIKITKKEYDETLKTQKTEQAQKEKEESQKEVILTDADLAIEMVKTLMAEGIKAQDIINAVRKK